MAVYPGAIVTFTTKRDLLDIVEAAHPNTVQSEVVAIQSAVGVNPFQSVTPNGASYSGTATTYASVSARLANLEHGIVADTHSQYVRKVGGDTIAPAVGTVGLVFQPPVGQNVNQTVWRNQAGTQRTHIDSQGDLFVFGGQTPVTQSNAASSVADSLAAGTAIVGASTNYARQDHRHALAAGVAGTSAVGDTAAEGSSSAVARADHRHAREAFGSPVASAVGDTAANGTAATPARSDHRHAREAFGGVVAQTSYSQASATGTASTLARSDHAHGTPPPTTVRIPHSFSVPGEILVPSGNDNVIPGFFVPVPSGQQATIRLARFRTDAGSAAISLRRNGTQISSNSATTTTANSSALSTALADGDYIQIVVTSVTSNPRNLSYSIYIDYNGS